MTTWKGWRGLEGEGPDFLLRAMRSFRRILSMGALGQTSVPGSQSQSGLVCALWELRGGPGPPESWFLSWVRTEGPRIAQARGVSGWRLLKGVGWHSRPRAQLEQGLEGDGDQC